MTLKKKSTKNHQEFIFNFLIFSFKPKFLKELCSLLKNHLFTTCYFTYYFSKLKHTHTRHTSKTAKRGYVAKSVMWLGKVTVKHG